MAIITELLDAWPLADDVRVIPRREDLLLQPPPENPMKMWREHDLLQAVHFPNDYIPAKFSPPKDVFCGDTLRLEWQQMNARQPFYHRNADVDEISLQVSGERTLMTELGSVELRPGDFSRIPVGVAHDNFGREEVHLLFYIIAPVTDVGHVTLRSEVKKEGPFPGWKKASPATIEMMTECLGARGCDMAVSLADEEFLLDPSLAQSTSFAKPEEALLIQRAVTPAVSGSQPQNPEWLYKSATVWIGNVSLDKTDGTVYHRHRRADAIQYQLEGSRTLVTQRGTIELHPGDYICIPKGCAYTNISKSQCQYVVILTSEVAPVKAPYSKAASETTLEKVEAIRKEVSV
ncbi:uncharacterized protein N7473_005973 [Penicillium subrubescens]|jgi:quercetin dioxygenase-like cupin family protein|uniref:Cupin 2 conserved barrel domain-containing protein n=1 Tax=Penicillium subrubescens TaxID=1316194 RepID=A0A1Q5UEV8_9EURO|nr:uncharacterized protein N7473_005973 [Penicillium subrubescens]KAJ5896574.1 hypothetical protein N7473_005973 [Penicillium subrubescens]OKP11010.1 hypothetical protein PENSUB_3531 [Penicillium subrubescens]